MAEEEGHFDWRVRLTNHHPVKNQGYSSFCWAITDITLCEMMMSVKEPHKPYVKLSLQELLDYYIVMYPDMDQEYEYDGSYGTRLSAAGLKYIMANGIAKEDDYHLIGNRQHVRFDKGVLSPPLSARSDLRISEVVNLGKTESALLAAIRQSPIRAEIFVYPSFHNHKKKYEGHVLGVYVYEPQISAKEEDDHHAVIILGFGEEDGVPYYLIQNSWGETWGENGYAKISRDLVVAACSIKIE